MSDIFEAPLPDGAVVAGRAPVLGGESAAPGGVAIYGGADLATYMSADGWLYVPYCGDRAGWKFGTHCFKIGPQGQQEWVELPAFTEGRAGVSLEPNGLFLSWPNDRGNRLTRLQVPGFVTPGWPSSGATAPAPIPTPPVSSTPPAALIDEGARAYTSQVKKELLAALSNLEAQVKALAARPVAGQADVNQIRDVIWNLPTVVDRIFAELAADNAGLVSEIERIARRALGR